MPLPQTGVASVSDTTAAPLAETIITDAAGQVVLRPRSYQQHQQQAVTETADRHTAVQ